MNKTKLITALAAKADISKAAAGHFMDALLEELTEALAKGDFRYYSVAWLFQRGT